MDIFLRADAWMALLSLTALEIVLGVDNILFISILTSKLPERKQQSRARKQGLFYALLVRLLFLFGIGYIIRATDPIVHISSFALSAKDLILLLGGLFLLYKSTKEIHEKVSGEETAKEIKPKKINFSTIIVQIVLLDIVFSFDSILTAIGLTEHIVIMASAIVISMIIMIIFIDTVGNFIIKHPTLQVLGLSFLILIGTLLIAEAFHYEIPKGYIYFAFFYSFVIELINMRLRPKTLNNET